MPAAAEPPGDGWRASLRLGFRRISDKTVLAERFHEGPLAVQLALYPEGSLCHLYLLHPPGATKFYRAETSPLFSAT